MTVSEVIEVLIKLNPNTPVYLNNGDGEVMVDEVELDNYYGHTRKVVIK